MCLVLLWLHLCSVPVNISSPPSDVTVVSPGNATLNCTADGVPAPYITWLREYNGMQMEISPLVQDPDAANLTVLEIQQIITGRTTVSTINFFFTTPPFAAEYTCRASNVLGTDEDVAVLTVQGEIELVVIYH